MSRNSLNKTIYKVVLTGGPCGGKTTGQDRLATFFENLGWRVYRVPETATILLKGGVRFSDLNEKQVFQFQEDLLRTLLCIEDTYFHLAETSDRNCLVICDRGAFDGSAYIDPKGWNEILTRNGRNPVDLRDNRYNQVVHLVTAAVGAQQYYTTFNNAARNETVAEASEKDAKTREVWVGHPYVDIVDNLDTENFEDKILKLIQVVCDRVGVAYGDRLAKNSRKRKFLVSNIFEDRFPSYQEFDVIHDYLHSEDLNVQARIRKRGQGGKWSYTHTVRRLVQSEPVETRMQISDREYKVLKAHRDYRRFSTYKKRRCFMHGNRYYQLDIYQPPLPPQSPDRQSLLILETYTTSPDEKLTDFPECLTVKEEVTGNPTYSMFNLSLREDSTPGCEGTKLDPAVGLDLAGAGHLHPTGSLVNLNEDERRKKSSPPSMFRFNTPPRDNLLNGGASTDPTLGHEAGIHSNDAMNGAL